MVITTSEFGRQIAENGSAGTDHARVACSSFGPTVAGGIVHGGMTRCGRRWRRAAVVDTRSYRSALVVGGPGGADGVREFTEDLPLVAI